MKSLRKLTASVTLLTLLATPTFAQSTASEPVRASRSVAASSRMHGLYGIDSYRVKVLDRNRSRVEALDAKGRVVAELAAAQSRHGFFELVLRQDKAVWRAKVGFSFMQETPAGMFITSMFDLHQTSPRSAPQSFAYLSDWVGERQLNVTYLMNDQLFRADLAEATSETQKAYEDAYAASGVGGLFENENSLLALDMLKDPKLTSSLPVYLRGLSDASLKHDGFSTTRDCALAAACAVLAWGGALACIGCGAASFSCGWGLAELTAAQ